MRVLSFGIYSSRPEYPRHRNLLDGLKANGVEIVECHYTMAAGFKERMKSAGTFCGRVKYGFRLMFSYVSLAVQFLRAPAADAILVGYPGYFHVRFVRLLKRVKNRKAVLVYDIFFSLYDALVNDRRMIKENSIAARLIHILETDACRAADICLMDTNAHGDYIALEFSLPREKIRRVFVGPTFTDSDIQYIMEKREGLFQVLFVGTYIPLHGIEVIIEAAKELGENSDIGFLLVGSGRLREEMEKKVRQWDLTNVEFRDWIDHRDLPDMLQSCELTLGVFGASAKASRVIPIKVFDICAAGVPFITGATPATREAFAHRENAYLVPPGDPVALAEAIRELKGDSELGRKIAAGAHELARSVFSVEEIGKELVKIIEDGKASGG